MIRNLMQKLFKAIFPVSCKEELEKAKNNFHQKVGLASYKNERAVCDIKDLVRNHKSKIIYEISTPTALKKIAHS